MLPIATEEDRTFELIQGVILAIDAKDRYTTRHSEDPARYGSFLAHRVGVDPKRAISIGSPATTST